MRAVQSEQDCDSLAAKHSQGIAVEPFRGTAKSRVGAASRLQLEFENGSESDFGGTGKRAMITVASDDGKESVHAKPASVIGSTPLATGGLKLRPSRLV